MMNDDKQRVVQMNVINPGESADDGDFTFELQPRFSQGGRIVKFALTASDADALKRALEVYIKSQ